MNLSPKQRQILKSYLKEKPRILILEGAVRSGKTFLNNAIFYYELRRRIGKGQNLIITGNTLGSIKRNVLDPMSSDFGIPVRMDQHGKLNLYGNKVHCFGTDKEDSYKAMTGMTGAGWYGNEVTLSHANSRQEALSRCSDKDAFIIWDTNPSYPQHPIKTDLIDKSGERLDSGRLWVRAWHFGIDDNPFLSAEYVENLKRTTPRGVFWDRYILGKWVMAEGTVYDEFDQNVHVYDPMSLPESWMRVRGIDYGYTNPFVCLWGALDYDGRLYIYDEHYQAKALIKDHAGAIEARGGQYTWTIADHDAQDNAEMRALGIYTRNAKKDVILGIQKVKQRMMVQPDGYPRLLISRKCSNLIREMGLYRWNDPQDGRNEKEEPVKENDHALDTARYMIMELDIGSGGVGDMAVPGI